MTSGDGLRNPYRIKKPKSEVVLRLAFRFQDQVNETLARGELRLTREYLWLSRELAIPLATITDVELVAKRRIVQITYVDILEEDTKAVQIHGIGFFGRSARLNQRLHDSLLNELEHAPSAEVFFREEGEVPVGCETCGRPEAALIQLRSVACFGVYPICGVLAWSPTKRYLCAKHAMRTCNHVCLRTALVGNLGFPGLLVSPWVVWRNLRALGQTFSASLPYVAFAWGLFGLLPLVVWGYVVLSLTMR